MNLGIVASKFNSEVTSISLKAAKEKAKELHLNVIEVIEVFGAFDSPLAVKKLFSRAEIDGVIVIGAIIKGQTEHDKVIAVTTFKSLQELSLEFNKPLGLAISGPGMTSAQAKKRANLIAENAVIAVKMLSEISDSKEDEEIKPRIL